MDGREIGRVVKAFCRSDYSYNTYLVPLEEDGTDRTWLAGACWLLAEALRRAVGDGQVIGIEAGGAFRTPAPRSVGHVALWLQTPRGDWFIDADGAFRPEAFLKKERELEYLIDPQFVPFTDEIQQRWRSNGTGTPPSEFPALADRLAADLHDLITTGRKR